MKPDNNKCLYCGIEISNKAKFCTDAHRKAYSRNSDKPNSDTDKEQVGQKSDIRDTLTKTDKTFYDRNDGIDEHGIMGIVGKDYYYFDAPLRDEECLHCGDKFQTNMKMLRFCSLNHYKDALAGRKWLSSKLTYPTSGLYP